MTSGDDSRRAAPAAAPSTSLRELAALFLRLGGMACLASDVICDYSFDRPLAPGDKLVFLDMAHYTMVKTTTFNGLACHRSRRTTR